VDVEGINTAPSYFHWLATNWTDSFHASFQFHFVVISDFVEGFVIDVVHPDRGPEERALQAAMSGCLTARFLALLEHSRLR
jgi:hypothetical protein